MKRQKLILLLLVVGLISSIFEMPMCIYASSAELPEHDEIQPRYTNLQSLSVSFGVDPLEDDLGLGEDLGEAVAAIIVSYYSNTKRIWLRVDFERKDPDGWFNLGTTWGGRRTSPADMEAFITVKHGYYYRAVVTVELYDADGNLAETVTLASVEDYF